MEPERKFRTNRMFGAVGRTIAASRGPPCRASGPPDFGSPRRARSTPRSRPGRLGRLGLGSQERGRRSGTGPPRQGRVTRAPGKFPSSSKVRSNARMVLPGIFQARMGLNISRLRDRCVANHGVVSLAGGHGDGEKKASDRGLGGRARASGLREREGAGEGKKTDKTGWEVGFGETHARRVAWPWCCSYRRVRRIRVDALLERDATCGGVSFARWSGDAEEARTKEKRRRGRCQKSSRPRRYRLEASKIPTDSEASKSPTGRPTDRPTIFVEKYFSAGASPPPSSTRKIVWQKTEFR